WRRARPGGQDLGILSARSLATAHRRLAELLRPGLRVLDVGCGPGAITRGIADAVGPAGRVVGVDLHPQLIAEARRWHDAVPGPDPPATARAFYARFLRWRTAAGLDNAIADHLAEMFTAVGLREVVATPQAEVSDRTDPDFQTRIGIWAETAAFHGPRMVEDGVLTEAERAVAAELQEGDLGGLAATGRRGRGARLRGNGGQRVAHLDLQAHAVRTGLPLHGDGARDGHPPARHDGPGMPARVVDRLNRE